MLPQDKAELLKVILECAERASSALAEGEKSIIRYIDADEFIQNITKKIEEYEVISTKTP